jgi:HlyD family secretion protein
MKTRLLIFISILMSAGCNRGTDIADAYGNFEATEVIISAETSGPVLKFPAEEGSLIKKGDQLALIDTAVIHLQIAEIDAAMRNTRTRIITTDAQNDIIRQQIVNLNINIDRIKNMLKNDAATARQLDDLTGQEAVYQKQIEANNSQKISIAAELSMYQAKKATLSEQLRRSSVRSPLSGTLIEKYSEEGEITAAGKPLGKIADLSLMKLKVYVSGAAIGKIRTGQSCNVRIDDGNKGYRSFTGTISYVSDKAEFTPKIIQTKEERVILVYAVKIDVVNDGTLKSGMPGEAIFTEKNK